MWLFTQIFFYLLLAFAIGAVGSWLLRGRVAEQAQDELQERFRQMVNTLEMERDAAKLRVRELREQLEAREGQPDEEGERGPPPADPGGEADRAGAGEPGSEADDGLEPDFAAGDTEEPESEAVDAVEPGPGTHVESGDPGVAEAWEPEVSEFDFGHERASALAEAEDQEAPGHPLSDLGEVPPEASNRLRGMGIHDTSALHRHFLAGSDPDELASTLDVQPRRVRRWRTLAELLEVPGLSPEDAWLLEISGLASIGELAAEDPAELVARMEALNEDQDLGLPVPGHEVVSAWVRWAAGGEEA